MLALSIILIFFSCSDEAEPIIPNDNSPDVPDIEENEYTGINQWILENMYLYYFWNDEIPDGPDMSKAPADFFGSLLYSFDESTNPGGDRFSFISEDADELMAEFSGESKSTGIQFRLFYKSSGSNAIMAQIIYVLHDSPADQAGLQRGDIFTRVNGITLDDENYPDLLYDHDHMTLTMAEAQNGTINELNESVTLNAVVLQENPVYLDSIYDLNGTKVGYLVYNQFIPGPYDSNVETFDEQLSAIFSSFGSSGINELIIDLRYNPGGYVSSAVTLASLIGKSVSSGDIFFKEEYNDEFQEYLEDYYGPDYFYVNFEDKAENVGDRINRVFFLVTGYSASSSELVINGLKPYMDVVLIGEQTYGKNVGSIPITADASDDHNWALQPIVMKAYNSLGHSDYTAGFVPDTEVIEPLDLVPFGDAENPLLKQALFMISGTARIARQEQRDMPGIIDASVAHKPVTMKRIANPGTEGSN